METIKKLGKFDWNSSNSIKDRVPTYIKGIFLARDMESNWAFYIEVPTLFEAYGKGIYSGNWRSCCNITNLYGHIHWQVENKPESWTDNEWWEFWGLVSGIKKLNEAYEFSRFGNHGCGDDKAVLYCRDIELAKNIARKLDCVILRANELLDKLCT